MAGAPALPPAAPPAARPAQRPAWAAAERCRGLARERWSERRPDEALALFERAAALFARGGRVGEQAAVLGELGSLHLELGAEEEALDAFARLLALGAAAVEPGLAAGPAGGSRAGLAGRLAALADPLEGRRLLAALRDRLGRRRAVLQRLDLTRSEGLVAAFARQEHPAERLLREAWSGYLRAGAPVQAGLAATDLAALFLRQGRAAALRDLGEEVSAAFRGRPLPPDARAALDRLARVLAEGDAAAHDLLDLLAATAGDLVGALGEG